MRPEGPIRVLIIDDASMFRNAVAAELERALDVHAVGTSGEIAGVREHLLRFHPEVIVLDIGLRTEDPLRLLRKLRVHYPVPVIVSAVDAGQHVARAIQAVRHGALEVIAKPCGSRPPELQPYVCELARKVQMAVSSARPVPRLPVMEGQVTSYDHSGVDPSRYLIAIGASTGGTEAIAALLKQVSADSPPIVIVQHMPVGFTESFAAQLNRHSAVRVTEAVEGESLRRGCALVARGDAHLIVRRAGYGWVARYSNQEPANRHRPSIDVLFDSVAAAKKRAIGILLTGMGADGARGLLTLRQAGGLTVAQDEASCVVYGMPKEAVSLGAAQYSAPPQQIPAMVLRLVRKQECAAQQPVGDCLD